MKVPRVASILFCESVVFQSLPAKIFMFGNGAGGGADDDGRRKITAGHDRLPIGGQSIGQWRRLWREEAPAWFDRFRQAVSLAGVNRAAGVISARLFAGRSALAQHRANR